MGDDVYNYEFDLDDFDSDRLEKAFNSNDNNSFDVGESVSVVGYWQSWKYWSVSRKEILLKYDDAKITSDDDKLNKCNALLYAEKLDMENLKFFPDHLVGKKLAKEPREVRNHRAKLVEKKKLIGLRSADKR